MSISRSSLRWVVLLAWVVGVVLLVVGGTPGGAAVAEAANSEPLTTPALIERAFAAGEITADERLLYFAYAVYEYESLPARFRGTVPYYATDIVAELVELRHAQADGRVGPLRTDVQAELERVLTINAATVCDQTDGPTGNVFETDNFHASYHAIGGSLSLDDYKTMLERTFRQQVTDYGWPKPPYCTAGTGGCTATNPWNRYPVLIAPIGDPTTLAYVTAGGLYSGQLGDNPNTPQTETRAGASCMVLRNDYDVLATDRSVTESDFLGAIVAHEYHHAIQRGLVNRGATGEPDRMWRESGSSYIEDEYFDGLNMNYGWLWPHFDTCLGEYNGSSDTFVYTNWLFLRYVAERNGGTNTPGGGENVLQGFWQNMGTGQAALNAFNAALEGAGSNLADTYHNYAIASRFMLACPAGTPYCFDEAQGYEDRAGDRPIHGVIARPGQSYSGALANHYAINWVRLPTDGSYPVSIANKSDNGALRVSIVARVGDKLTVTPMPQVIEGRGQVSLTYTPPSGAAEVFAVITNQQQTSGEPSSCSTSDYVVSLARIAFVIDDTGSMGDEIDQVKTTVTKKVDEFTARSLLFEYHLITYKDDVNYRGKTTEAATIKSWVNALTAQGGGDCPEEMLGALDRLAVEAPNSEAWVMTDAGFHNASHLPVTIYHLLRAHVKVNPIVYDWCFKSGGQQTTTAPPGDALADGESFAQLAAETGGHYFQIDSGETEAATDILLTEMTAPSDLMLYRDTVSGAKNYGLDVDGTADSLNVLLNVFDGNADVALRDPTGAAVGDETPGVIVTTLGNVRYVQVASPQAGRWQADVSGDGTFALSASGETAIDFQYLGDTTLTNNVAALFIASLTGPVTEPVFELIAPDGAVVATPALVDDGLHDDGAADDGVYGGRYAPLQPGSFFLRVRGMTEGAPFERTSTETIRVHALRVQAPPGQTVAPDGLVSYQFTISNNGPTADTVDLSALSDGDWIVTPAAASVPLAAYETKSVVVALRVPADATDGDSDELVLAAVSQANPLATDAASVVTLVETTPPPRLVFLPATLLQIEPTPTCTNAVANPSFEENAVWQINANEFPAAYWWGFGHSGVRSMRIGINYANDNRYSYSSIEQAVRIPSPLASAKLGYWLYPQTSEPVAVLTPPAVVPTSSQERAKLSDDAQMVLVLHGNGQQTVLRFMRQNPERWVYYEDDLSAFRGQTVRVYFGVFNNGWGGITAMWADDVTVDICR